MARRQPRPGDFTEEEEERIKQLWPSTSIPEIAMQIGRSPVSVAMKARRLGLTPKGAQRWTEFETNLLKALHSAGESLQVMEDRLYPRTAFAIPRKLVELGLKQQSVPVVVCAAPVAQAVEPIWRPPSAYERAVVKAPSDGYAKRCQYPLWEGFKPPRPALFCNAGTDGRSSFCAEHHRACYVVAA